MRDAAQHVAAQELAVDVDELRVRAEANSKSAGPAALQLRSIAGPAAERNREKGPSIRGDNYAGKFMRRIRLWKRGSGLKSSKQGSTFSKTIHSACCWYAVSSH